MKNLEERGRITFSLRVVDDAAKVAGCEDELAVIEPAIQIQSYRLPSL